MRAVPSPPFLRRMAKGLPVASKMMPVAKRKFGCLMGMLPSLFTKSITDWCLENIPDFHLGPGGREFRSHVTVKFGFVDSSPNTIEAVKEFLQGRPPLQVRLGGFDLFTTGYGKWKNEDGDVLFIEADSPDLHRLNAELSAAFPCKDTHPEYKPHVTVAYLDPAVAESYRGLKAPFLNCSLILDTLEWSGADGMTEQFSLSILPQLGSKALDERKNKLGHRYCIDTDTGKRVPCPPKAEEGEEKESAKKKPEGKRPAKKPVEPSTERHQRVLKAIGTVSKPLASGLKRSKGISEQQRNEYAEATAKVLHKMPKAARQRVEWYLDSAQYHSSTLELTKNVVGQALSQVNQSPAMREHWRKVMEDVQAGKSELLGAVVIAAGRLSLHLDGAGNEGTNVGRYAQKSDDVPGTYAHEMGHVLDGPDRMYSSSASWRKIFAEEIDGEVKESGWWQAIVGGESKAKLTTYARSMPSEGFAEFSRLLYGSDVPLEEIEKQFPKCSEFFKEQRFWPDRKGKVSAAFRNIFDERIPLDDQGSHADSLIIEKAKKTEKTMDTRSAKPSPPSLKSFPNYGIKGEGTCKPGQTRANTGCTPASGGGGKKPSGSSDEGKTPSQPQSRKQRLKEKLRAAKERAVAIKDRIKEGGAEAIHTANKAIIVTKNFFRDLSERILGKTATKTAEVVIEKVQDTVNQILLGEDYDIPDDPAGLGLDIALNLVPDTVAYLYRVAKVALGGEDPRNIKYPEKSLPEGIDLSEIADMIVELQEEYIQAGMDVVPMDRDGVLQLLEQNLAEPGAVGQKSLIYWVKGEGSYFGNCERDDQGHCLPSGEAGQKKPAERPKQTRKDKRQAGKQKRQKVRKRTKEQRRAIKDMVRGLDKATAAIKGKLKNGKMTVQAARAGAAAFVDSVAEKLGLDEGDRKRIKDKIEGYTKETSEDFGKKGEGELPTSGKHGPTLKVLKAVVPELVAQVYRRVKKARTGKDPRDEPANSQTVLRRILGPKLHEAMMTPLGGRTEKETPGKEQTARLRAALEKEWEKIQKEGKGKKYLLTFQKALSWLDSNNGGALVPPAQMGKKIPLGRPRKGKKLTPPSLKTFGWHKDGPDEKDSLNELKAFPLPTRPEEEDAHQIGQALEMALERYNKLRHSIGDNDVIGVRNAVNNPKWMLMEAAKDDVERLERHYAQARGKSVEQKALEIGRLLGGGHTFRRVDGLVKGGFTGERPDKLGRRMCYNEGKRVPCPKKEGEIPKNPTPADEEGGKVNSPDTTTPAEKEPVRPEFVPSRPPEEVQSDIADTEQELETLRKVNLEGQSIGVRHGIEKARKKAEQDLEELRREATDAETKEPWEMTASEFEAKPKNPTWGDWVTTPDGKFGMVSGGGGIGNDRVKVRGVDGSVSWQSRADLNYVRTDGEPKNRHTESADEWAAQVTDKVQSLRDQNQKLLLNKVVTDKFRNALAKGDISQELYDRKVKDGSLLDESQYEQAKRVEAEIERVRNTPLNIKPNAVHEAIVRQALATGKPVPESVLADYPDLKPAVKPPSVRKRTPKKPALKPKVSTGSSDSLSGHPFSGMSREQMVQKLSQEGTVSDTEPNPRGYNFDDFPSGVDGRKITRDVSSIVHSEKKKQPFGRPTIADVYDKVREENPSLSLIDFQNSLAKMSADGIIRLTPWTQSASSIPRPEAAMPYDREKKYFIDLPDEPKAKKPALKPKEKPAATPMPEEAKQAIKEHFESSSFPVLLTNTQPGWENEFPDSVNVDLSGESDEREVMDKFDDAAGDNEGKTLLISPPKDKKAARRLALLIKNAAEDGTRVVVHSDDDSAGSMMELNRDLQGRSRVVKAGPDKPKAKKPKKS